MSPNPAPLLPPLRGRVAPPETLRLLCRIVLRAAEGSSRRQLPAFDHKRVQDAFLTPGNAASAHSECVSGRAQRMTEELVESRVLFKGAYSVDWRLPAQPHLRPIRIEALIVVSLLSLGLWVAIWEGVSSVASALPSPL